MEKLSHFLKIKNRKNMKSIFKNYLRKAAFIFIAFAFI